MQLPALAVQQTDLGDTLTKLAYLKGASLQNRLGEAQLAREEKLSGLRGQIFGGGEAEGAAGVSGEGGMNMSALKQYAEMDPKGAKAILDFANTADEAQKQQARDRASQVAKPLLGILNMPPEQQPMAYQQMLAQARQSGMAFQQEPPRQWNPQWAEAKVMEALSMEEAMKRAESQRKAASDAPTTREVKRGDQIVTEEYAGGKWREVGKGRRYKPQEGGALVGETKIGKLLIDQKNLRELGYDDDHPAMRAIDREIAKAGRPSGESARWQEMIVSGRQTLDSAVSAYMPEGLDAEPDMSVVASAWLNAPKTDGRTTNAQMKEATSMILRLETGAQANESEVSNVMSRYMPSPLDKPETVKDKLERFQRRFENASEIAEGRQGKARTDKDSKLLKEAEDAISKGAPRDAVISRLKERGIELPEGF